jgi:transcriptional regulator with XRE-family HTH domain
MSEKYNKQEQTLLTKVGKRIRALRNETGLSQEDFAKKCDLDRTYISDVERGERNISIINLNKIAKTLKITLAQLLEI